MRRPLSVQAWEGAAPPRAALGRSARLAGALLLASGAIGLVAFAFDRLLLPGTTGLGMIDCAIAGALLSGHRDARGWALVRAGIGAMVLASGAATLGTPDAAIVPALFSLALFGLLVGTPGRGRVALSLLLAASALGLTALGAIRAPGSDAPVGVQYHHQGSALPYDVDR